MRQASNPEVAEQLLAETGSKGSAGFPTLQLYCNSESASAQQIATFWAQNLQQVLGVTIEPTPIDLAQLQSMRTNRDPALIIYLGNWFEDYVRPQNRLSLV